MKIYIGFKENEKPEIFEAEITPTKQTHPQYDFIYSPFESAAKAKQYISAMGGLACGDG